MRILLFAGLSIMVLLFTAILLLIRLQPAYLTPLQIFLTPPESCAPPCFMGVRPHQTSVTQALAILRANPHITDAQLTTLNRQQTVSWRWQQDDMDNTLYTFYASNHVITEPAISYTVTLGEMVLALGMPTRATAGIINSYLPQPGAVLEYDRHGLYLFITTAPCNTLPDSYWQLYHRPSTVSGFSMGLTPADFSRMQPQHRQALDPRYWRTQLDAYCRTMSL